MFICGVLWSQRLKTKTILTNRETCKIVQISSVQLHGGMAPRISVRRSARPLQNSQLLPLTGAELLGSPNED